MLKASTPLSTLSKYKIRKIANIIRSFCGEHLGKLRNKAYPRFTLSFSKSADRMGIYDGEDNYMVIYVNQCKTVSDLTSTIIHEWTHSKQRIVAKYTKLYLKYGYVNHPMEIEARDNEVKYNRKSLNYLKKRING